MGFGDKLVAFPPVNFQLAVRGDELVEQLLCVPCRLIDPLNACLDAPQRERLGFEFVGTRGEHAEDSRRLARAVVEPRECLVESGEHGLPLRELFQSRRQCFAFRPRDGDEELEIARLLLDLTSAHEAFDHIEHGHLSYEGGDMRLLVRHPDLNYSDANS